MRTTQKKGDIAKAKAISKFTDMGYDVAILITESASYDILVDVEGDIKKVQVKYSSRKEVDLRKIHSNSSGYVVKKQKANEYDWLYIFSSDGKEYLYKECEAGRQSIYLNDKYII